MPITVPAELRHRGQPLVEYPRADLWRELGGDQGVTELINDLYRRIEADPLLRTAFPHFNAGAATPFFIQWFGGDRTYSDDLTGGLMRRHEHRYISPKTAAAWLRCMREAITARGINAEPIMRPLARVARAMIHSDEVETRELNRACAAVQDQSQVHFESLLNDALQGKIDRIRSEIANDPALLQKRGTENRNLVWAATYRNRVKILELLLDAGADCNSPACDPLHTTMAGDVVRLGTGVSVTPLAIAKKLHPALIRPLHDHGAIDDVFTAAWLGDVPSMQAFLDRNPELVNAIDPADDFQEVSLLCHAVCGGNLEAVQLLLARGAEVRRHSGKLLTFAVVMNRVDLVKTLIDHGADIHRVNHLGRLDDAERPVADLLISLGIKVPGWMLPRTCRPDVSRNEVHRVNVLLDYGANINDRERYGLTALHYAIRGGKLPLIRLLLDRGASVNSLDDSGVTPLLHLTKTRSKADPLPTLELLASHGADLNARDENGNTLLMHFVRQGNVEVVKWLIGHGADSTVRNNAGKTAGDVAGKRPGMVMLLSRAAND